MFVGLNDLCDHAPYYDIVTLSCIRPQSGQELQPGFVNRCNVRVACKFRYVHTQRAPIVARLQLSAPASNMLNRYGGLHMARVRSNLVRQSWCPRREQDGTLPEMIVYVLLETLAGVEQNPRVHKTVQ